MPPNDSVAETETKPQLPGWKRALFVTIVSLTVLTMLEGGSRLGLRLFRGFDGVNLYQYEFDPYRNIHPVRGFEDTRGIKHNSAGFRRSSEVAVEKPKGVYRIFLMGASTAYGMGGLWPQIQRDFAVLRNDQTIDAYLESILRDSLPGVQFEVINAGVTSSWTHHHLIYLNQHILKYSPDYLLFLDGFNDFFHVDPRHDQFASYAYGLPSRTIMGPPTLHSLGYANAWWLFRKSAFAHVVSRAVSGTVMALRWERAAPMDVERSLNALREVFPRNALKMHERSGLIARAEGARVLFMLQPLLILERERRGMTEVEKRLFDFNVASWPEGYEEFSRQAVPFIVEQEKAMAARVGARFLDLSQPYDGAEEQVYTDYAHLTPRGNRILAERIAADLMPEIRAAVLDNRH